ncbi:RNA-binding protein 41 [Trichonephila inaurata madagascariensis]|uniref:RNA-binding protein 41 n=1 Tax=Trichonephila inaurata madagascariensis TaxID=2747483 RepID=A0A8X6JRF9_9ARAC|nr:RNA-binding protein 41 [Trichonephila inaurata madagascariensis]
MTYQRSMVKIYFYFSFSSIHIGNNATMTRIVHTARFDEMRDDELNQPQDGDKTEAEQYMKDLLQMQTNTKLTMKELTSRHRTFVYPSTHKPLALLARGECSMQEFDKIMKDEEIRQQLEGCGLAQDEITDYFTFKFKKKGEDRLVNPSILEEKISKIDEKIKMHESELLIPQEFRSVKKITRHEMEIENALYAGCEKKRKLAALVTTAEQSLDVYTEGAMSHIKKLSNELLRKGKEKRRRKEKLKCENNSSSTDEPNGFQFDSNIHHATVPLEESEVVEQRLSVKEIRKIPRFENYKIGEPSKTLYVKNLHLKITEQELRSVFGRFEEENKALIVYRICTGRMKGQAFVTFSNANVAEKALYFANGYPMREKRIVIEFGRKT